MIVETERVIDTSDPRVALFTRLTDMDLRQRIEPARGIFMAEGHLVIERCARADLPIVAVLTEDRWLPRLQALLGDSTAPVYVADEATLRAITGYRVHRGALAAVQRPPAYTVDDLLAGTGDVLVLEDLVDPTNVGLAIRSAVAQGVDAFILSPACADPLYRRAVKASMGTVMRCRWARSDDWSATLAGIARSRRLIALTPGGETSLATAMAEAGADPVALAVGSEGPGLSGRVLHSAWRRCAIEMASSEDSLNVAAAVAVAVYARSRSMPE